MKKFDYSFLKNMKIPNNVLSLYLSIEKIQGLDILNEGVYPEVFSSLQNIAKYQSIDTSNAIDDIVTSNHRMELLIDEKISIKNENEEKIICYKDILNEIHSNFNDYQFNEYNIKYFHKMLTSNTSYKYGGIYKKEDNLVIEELPGENRRVLFSPLSSEKTSEAMEQLIKAYNDAFDDDEIPNLLLIPCVILDFLCIYPFENDNGRLSRLLSLLLLYKNEYSVGKYVSFEKQIYRSISEYYKAIRLSSINWDKNSNDYYPFIEYFLKSLYSCHYELNSRFNIVNGEKKSKKFRIAETIKISHNPISRKEIHLVWPDISHETIKKVIKNLLNSNKIMKIGNFKDARYKRNWYGKTSQSDENMIIF